MVTFSRQIRWLGQISCSAVQISWHEGKIDMNWNTQQGFQHIKGQNGVVFQGQSSGDVKSADINITSLKWLTVAMPYKRIARDKRETRERQERT